jgi:hypothetical protein
LGKRVKTRKKMPKVRKFQMVATHWRTEWLSAAIMVTPVVPSITTSRATRRASQSVDLRQYITHPTVKQTSAKSAVNAPLERA